MKVSLESLKTECECKDLSVQVVFSLELAERAVTKAAIYKPDFWTAERLKYLFLFTWCLPRVVPLGKKKYWKKGFMQLKVPIAFLSSPQMSV